MWVCSGPFYDDYTHETRCARELWQKLGSKQNQRLPDRTVRCTAQRSSQRDSGLSPVKLVNGIWENEPKRRHDWTSTNPPFFSRKEDRVNLVTRCVYVTFLTLQNMWSLRLSTCKHTEAFLLSSLRPYCMKSFQTCEHLFAYQWLRVLCSLPRRIFTSEISQMHHVICQKPHRPTWIHQMSNGSQIRAYMWVFVW